MSELFNGTWSIDVAHSKVWDDASGSYRPDEVGDETITLSIKGEVQDYEVLYGDKPKVRMGYTATYDSAEWVPYLVREISGVSAAEEDDSISEFKRRIKASDGQRERHFVVGKPYGMVRLVYVDPSTHYRVSRSGEDGSAQSIMLRRMAEDGQSYLATVLDINGIVYRVRKFVRAQ
jgi:hypothetical protein